MANTYIIIDVTINHPTNGEIVKQNIEYYIDGKFDSTEFYSRDGVVYGTIREGFIKENRTAIEIEYDKYIQRVIDGQEQFLMLMAELRLNSIANNYPREVLRDIETRLESVKSQVIDGQWKSALEKLEGVEVAGYFTQPLYDRIHLALTTYIEKSYV